MGLTSVFLFQRLKKKQQLGVEPDTFQLPEVYWVPTRLKCLFANLHLSLSLIASTLLSLDLAKGTDATAGGRLNDYLMFILIHCDRQ